MSISACVSAVRRPGFCGRGPGAGVRCPVAGVRGPGAGVRGAGVHRRPGSGVQDGNKMINYQRNDVI